MSVSDFFSRIYFEKKSQIKKKVQQNKISSFALIGVKIEIKDGSFSFDVGMEKFHPTKGTNWVSYINQNYFDSYVCSPPQKRSLFSIKRNGRCKNFE